MAEASSSNSLLDTLPSASQVTTEQAASLAGPNQQPKSAQSDQGTPSDPTSAKTADDDKSKKGITFKMEGDHVAKIDIPPPEPPPSKHASHKKKKAKETEGQAGETPDPARNEPQQGTAASPADAATETSAAPEAEGSVAPANVPTTEPPLVPAAEPGAKPLDNEPAPATAPTPQPPPADGAASPPALPTDAAAGTAAAPPMPTAAQENPPQAALPGSHGVETTKLSTGSICLIVSLSATAVVLVLAIVLDIVRRSRRRKNDRRLARRSQTPSQSDLQMQRDMIKGEGMSLGSGLPPSQHQRGPEEARKTAAKAIGLSARPSNPEPAALSPSQLFMDRDNHPYAAAAKEVVSQPVYKRDSKRPFMAPAVTIHRPSGSFGQRPPLPAAGAPAPRVVAFAPHPTYGPPATVTSANPTTTGSREASGYAAAQKALLQAPGQQGRVQAQVQAQAQARSQSQTQAQRGRHLSGEGEAPYTDVLGTSWHTSQDATLGASFETREVLSYYLKRHSNMSDPGNGPELLDSSDERTSQGGVTTRQNEMLSRLAKTASVATSATLSTYSDTSTDADRTLSYALRGPRTLGQEREGDKEDDDEPPFELEIYSRSPPQK